MNIVFKKIQEAPDCNQFILNRLGITQCFVKELNSKSDRDSILRTAHRHASYETHIILSGSQSFEIEDKIITISAGELLLISPYTRHKAVSETDDYKKLAIVFALSPESMLISKFSQNSSHFKACVPEKLLVLLDFMKEEQAFNAPFSEMISEMVASECILLTLRFICDDDANDSPKDMEDARVSMAKQFIKDNIQNNLSIQDVASYCYLGNKQLSRIFYQSEQCTVAEYIRVLKIEHIKKLLSDERCSIRQISEIMNFSSEHYMVKFFKKHVGITPSEYRKSMPQT